MISLRKMTAFEVTCMWLAPSAAVARPTAPSGGARIGEVQVRAVPGAFFIDRALSVVAVTITTLLVAAATVATTVEVPRTVLSAGVLEPPSVWQVRPQEAGIVSRVLVQSGQLVHRGDTLLILDNVPIREAINTLETTIATADLASWKASTNRPFDVMTAEQRVMQSHGSASRARSQMLAVMVDNGIGMNVDSVLKAGPKTAHIALDVARANVQQADADAQIAILALSRLRRDTSEEVASRLTAKRARMNLQLLRQRYSHLAICTPIDGVVLTDGVTRLVGQSVREGEKLFELGSALGWTARLLVGERQAALIHVGQAAVVEMPRADGPENLSISGTVKAIGAEPWHATGDADGLVGVAGTGSGYLTLVQLDSGQATPLSQVARRGRTVNARIITGRAKLGMLLYEKMFGKHSVR